MACLPIELIERDLLDSDVAGYSATGDVTRDRRRKPFQLARGAMYAELQFGRPGYKTIESGQFRHLPAPNFRRASFRRTRLSFSLCSNSSMNDRPASWRMPTPKQMEKLAASMGKGPARERSPEPTDDMPDEYWRALLDYAPVLPADG